MTPPKEASDKHPAPHRKADPPENFSRFRAAAPQAVASRAPESAPEASETSVLKRRPAPDKSDSSALKRENASGEPKRPRPERAIASEKPGGSRHEQGTIPPKQKSPRPEREVASDTSERTRSEPETAPGKPPRPHSKRATASGKPEQLRSKRESAPEKPERSHSKRDPSPNKPKRPRSGHQNAPAKPEQPRFEHDTASDSGETRAKGRSFHLHRAEHDPRAAALEVLSRVLFGAADSQAALDDALQTPSLTPTDKRLCTELVYGILRRYLSLESFAESFLRRPDKLPGEMRLTLLLALYEMAWLRIPHHASVGWAVSHVRNRFGQGLAGVANGALRAMQRSLRELVQPRHTDSLELTEEEALARRFAMPVWIVRLWLHSYGPHAARVLLKAAANAAPAGLRLNRARSDWEKTKEELVRLHAPEQVALVSKMALPPSGQTAPFTAESVPSSADLLLAGACGLAFSGSLPWQARILLKDGKASRQSAAAYEALEAFSPASWQLPIWDCCAGRGGKTLPLLEQGIAVDLASDPSEQRLSALAAEYARLGLTHPPCPDILPLSVEEAADHLSGHTPPRTFGTILIDAPCSGLGTLSRRPEIRLRRTQADMEALAALQKRILELAWERLKPGGCLIYLTCTLNPAENQGQIADFLTLHAEAEVLKEFQTDCTSPLREFFYGAQLRKTTRHR